MDFYTWVWYRSHSKREARGSSVLNENFPGGQKEKLAKTRMWYCSHGKREVRGGSATNENFTLGQRKD